MSCPRRNFPLDPMRENVEKLINTQEHSQLCLRMHLLTCQKVGKSLMLPVSAAIAGILLGVGSANFSWLPAVVSHVMAEAGGSVLPICR